jgi:hypothetical protein
MKRLPILLLSLSCLALAGWAPADVAPIPALEATEAPDWIVKKSDHICGLSNAKMLSNPAKVDYAQLLQATPEIKKLKDEQIDPKSPEGAQLRAKAATRVATVCETVRVEKGHCSVWKAVKHKDGRAISDITTAVKGKL